MIQREVTALVDELVLNGRKSKEGSYNRTVDQDEPQKVKRNNHDEGIERNESKYKDFMASKPPSISGSPTLVEFMDWISEMEMVFDSYYYSDRHKTILEVR